MVLGYRKKLAERGNRMRLTTMGVSRNFTNSIIGIVNTSDVPADQRSRYVRFFSISESRNPSTGVSFGGYRAVLSHNELAGELNVPFIHLLRESDHIKDGDIVALDGITGNVRSLYRPQIGRESC